MSSLQIQINPTPKQHLAWQKYHDQTTTEILPGGGAGGGKSLWLSQVIASSALRYPGSRWLLGRSVLKTLKQTTLLTLIEVLTRWGLKADEHYVYNQQESTITFSNGSVIYLKDQAHYPSDPNYDRLGSSEYTGAAIDEANQIQAKAKEVVASRLRYKLSEFGLIPKLLLSCNPAKNWVYGNFYKPWHEGKLPDYRAFIPALVTDNSYISPHYIESVKRLKDPCPGRLSHPAQVSSSQLTRVLESSL